MLGEHTVVILDGDVQVAAELAVGRGLDIQRLHQVHIIVPDEPQIWAPSKGFHLKVASLDKIILLG